MGDESGRKRTAADSFGENASEYVDSPVHAAGDDLDRLAGWCADADRALDVATGAGHTAGAVRDRGVPDIVAMDASTGMVETATIEYPDLTGLLGDAERLPFRDDAFDAVTCRIAAHHFPDPETFVREVARVTAPGGVFAFEDNVAPEDETLDEFLNRVERLRDPSHVRSHAPSTWVGWLEAAGFAVEEEVVIAKEIDYRSWVEQLDTPTENRRRLEELFASPPAGAAELFDVTYDEDGVVSFSNLKVLLRGRR